MVLQMQMHTLQRPALYAFLVFSGLHEELEPAEMVMSSTTHTRMVFVDRRNPLMNVLDGLPSATRFGNGVGSGGGG